MTRLEQEHDGLELEEPLGLALSGGGVRASLFSLGALMSLVDSGQNKRVSDISSVSGGSITNAAVAQRCDFSRVTPNEFDSHAQEVAGALTRGLVPKWPVIIAYGILVASALSIVAFSWPLALPVWVDLLLLGAVGFAVLMRGMILAWLLRRGILRNSAATLSDLAQRSVNHVFCATDLNSSGPTYMMSHPPHFMSPAWGKPVDAARGGDLTVAKAVRASAAFPGGLPPVRIRIGDYGLRPTVGQFVAWHTEKAFTDMKIRSPRMMYLADGGVWNNIGTDWFLRARRTDLLLHSEFGYGEAQQFLVVDASAPAVAKMSLWYLRYPWLAEIGSIVRTLKALSASTVLSRIEPLKATIAEDGKRFGHCVGVVRLVDRVQASDAWATPGWHQRRAALHRRLSIDTEGLETSDRWYWRSSDDLFRANALVPTMLFSVAPETALALMLHGYCATRVALLNAGLVESDDWPVPPVARFAEIVGLRTADIAGATWVARETPDPAPATRMLAPLARAIDGLLRITSETGAATQAAVSVNQQARETLDAGRRWRAEFEAARKVRREVHHAHEALIAGNKTLAVEIFARNDRDGQLSALDLLAYARAYPPSPNGPGLSIAVRAERSASEQDPTLLSQPWFALLLAECFAKNRQCDRAVASLDRISDATYLSHLAKAVTSDPAFDPIRTEPAFTALVEDLSKLVPNDRRTDTTPA